MKDNSVPYGAPFWDNADDSAGPTQCWPWTRSLNSQGYGQVRFSDPLTGRIAVYRANRIAFFLANDRWPDGVRNSCRDRACVNPLHLIDGAEARQLIWQKSHCLDGHPYDEANTYRGPKGLVCRACGRKSSARYYRRTQGAQIASA